MTTTTAPRTARGFERLHQRAMQAGRQAAEGVDVTPMIVEDPYVGRTYVVPSGVCGFAWVSFAGNTGWGRWARKTGWASKGYPTGLVFRVTAYGQSMTRKEAYAQAYAQVLREAGITAYAESRMD